MQSTTPGFRAPPPPPPGPPPGADPQLWQWFQTVDADRSGSISASELREALVNGDWSSFDLDTVKMLMGIFDTNRSGTVDFNEFAGLWKYIKDWQGVFRHFDTDRSGFIDGDELHHALSNFGYNLSPTVLNLIEQKYATPPNEHGELGGITFDRFVRACIVIKTATEGFQKYCHLYYLTSKAHNLKGETTTMMVGFESITTHS